MRKRFKEQVEQAAELRTLFVLIVLLIMCAWRAIPKLRIHQVLFPATLLQTVVFIIAALHLSSFVYIVVIGNIIIVALALLPSTFKRTGPARHWINTDI